MMENILFPLFKEHGINIGLFAIFMLNKIKDQGKQMEIQEIQLSKLCEVVDAINKRLVVIETIVETHLSYKK